MPCPWTSRTRSSSRPTCAPRSSMFEIWHPMPCSSSSAITRPQARSVASSEVCRGRRWRDSCTPSSPKVSGRLSCGDSCPRSGQVRCTPQRVGLSLLSANADLIRAHLANAPRAGATHHRGGRRRVDRFRELPGDVQRTALARSSGAGPRSRADRGAHAAASGRRSVTFCANTRAQSVQERGRTRRPTRTEPR